MSDHRRGAGGWWGAVVLLFAAGCAIHGAGEAAAEQRLAPGTAVRAVSTPDGARQFVLHVPAAPPRRFRFSRPYPLLLLLHGSNSDGATIERESGMDSLAERYHVVVAYPDGARSILGRVTADWNAGECCGYAQHRQIDDVGFLRAIVEDVSRRLPIDQRRIYVGGFSDGGRMAYRAACELADRVAAIAVVSGSLKVAGCHPMRPVPLIAIHGTADDNVSYDDAVPDSVAVAGPDGAGTTPPSLRYWARLADCRTFAEQRIASHVRRGTFGRCAGSAITLLTVDGGTHGWPDGGTATDSTSAMHQLAASEAILQFLLRMRR